MTLKKTKVLSVRLDVDTIDYIDEQAAKEGVNRIGFIRKNLSNPALTFATLMMSTHRQLIALKSKPKNFYCNNEVKKILDVNGCEQEFLGMVVCVRDVDTFFCGQ